MLRGKARRRENKMLPNVHERARGLRFFVESRDVKLRIRSFARIETGGETATETPNEQRIAVSFLNNRDDSSRPDETAQRSNTTFILTVARIRPGFRDVLCGGFGDDVIARTMPGCFCRAAFDAARARGLLAAAENGARCCCRRRHPRQHANARTYATAGLIYKMAKAPGGGTRPRWLPLRCCCCCC